MSLERLLVDLHSVYHMHPFHIPSGELRITLLSNYPPSEFHWEVQIGTERGRAIGLHSRTFYYTPNNNHLGLLRAALNALDEEVFEDGFDSPDLARGQHGAGGEIQGG